MSWDNVTAASHVTLVVALVFVGLNLYAVGSGKPGRLGAALAIVAMLVERSYYVFARLLAGHQIDLWSAHPAPALLSFSVAISVFAIVALPMWDEGGKQRRDVVVVGIAMAALWTLVALRAE
ncbi:hypothetical protein [Pseudaestuariivita sp.]|uniref:hypothetical protein n=1 Tax=Pseudaestuariivita sp. TaxID=2211669 RepID=UPI0040599C73